MQIDILQSIFEGYQQGLKSKQIADKLGKSHCNISHVYSMFRHGGYDVTRELLVDRKYIDYTINDLILIAEDLVVNSIGIAQGIVKYRIEYNRIAKLIKMRKDKGKSLIVSDIKQLPWANKHNIKSDDKRLPKSVRQEKHSQLLVADDLTEEEVKKSQIKPHIAGKSKTRARHYAKKKINRNKQVMEAKKQQERIKKRIEESKKALENASSESNESYENKPQAVSKPLSASCQMPKGKQAKDYLSEDGQYIKQRGRKPYIDPDSELFDLLPIAVQKFSLERRRVDLELEKFVSNRLMELQPKNKLERFKLFVELNSLREHKKQPFDTLQGVSKRRLFLACGINPSEENFLQYRLQNPVDKYEEVKKIMIDLYKEHQGKLGRVTMTNYLWNSGYRYCDQTIYKLMKELSLVYDAPSKMHYNSYAGGSNVFLNVLNRDFSATAPLTKIVTDITMIPCKEGQLYLSVFLDLHTKEILTATVNSSPTEGFVLDGLFPVLEMIKANDQKCIIHSDQGVHYQHPSYCKAIADVKNAEQSMSRKGNCYDNGACESFFHLLKSERIFKSSDTYEANMIKVFNFIEYYNKYRIKIEHDGVSPSFSRMLLEGKITSKAA